MTALAAPVVYRDAQVAAVLYRVPSTVVANHMAGTGLVPVTLGGQAIINAAWFDYPNSSIGRYREFSLGILSSSRRIGPQTLLDLIVGRAGALGAYVVALPVDSELARAGGVELYGLPKSLAEFTLGWTSSQLDAGLSVNGTPAFEMHVPLRRGLPVWIRQLVIFSRRNDELVTTRITTRWRAQIDWVSRPRLMVTDVQQPVGSLLTELGVESASVLATVHGRMAYAELPVPGRPPPSSHAP